MQAIKAYNLMLQTKDKKTKKEEKILPILEKLIEKSITTSNT